MTLNQLLQATVLSLLMAACSKNDLPEASGTRLRKIQSTDGDSSMYTSLYYDGQGRLAYFTDSNSQGHFWKTVLEYGAEGLVTGYREESNFQNGPVTKYHLQLVYNNWKQVEKKIREGKVSNSYSYDAAGRLVADSGHNYWTGAVQEYTRFGYDGAGNVADWERFGTDNGQLQRHGKHQVWYNTAANPRYLPGPVFYIIRNDIQGLSPVLRTRVLYADGLQETYRYEYYSNGMVHRVVKELTGYAPNTQTYFYE